MKFICNGCANGQGDPCIVDVGKDWTVSVNDLRCVIRNQYHTCKWEKYEDGDGANLQPTCNKLATNLQDKKLPDLCKVGSWVWDERNGYGEVKSVRDDRSACNIEFKCGGGDFVPEALANLKLARLMSYDYQSITEALGKAVSNDSAVGLVTGYDIATVRVFGKFIPFNVFRQMFRYLDGSPCGCLEHLENGEWVK